MEKWWTGKEKDELEYSSKKRDVLQKEIARRHKDLQRQNRNQRQREALHAGRDEARYLQEHKKK